MKLNRKKLVAAGAASLFGLGAFAGVGQFATWTDSVSTEAQNLTAGTGTISLSDGNLRQSVNSSASDIVPGDVITREVTVLSTTSYDLATVALDVDVTGDTELLDGTPNAAAALQAKVERLDGSGAVEATLFDGAAKDMASANIGGAVLTAAGVSETDLRVTITFPSTADNAAKGKAAHFVYNFIATQRAGMAR